MAVKRKVLIQILSVLEGMVQGEMYTKNHGICCNLYFVIDGTSSVESFLEDAFIEIYGADVHYPIEGDRYLYQLNNNKWDTSTPHGKERVELLHSLIAIAKRRLG